MIQGLIWTAVRNRSSNEDEDVEEETERSDGEDNQRDGKADLPKVSSESASEKQQRNLHHQRQRLQHRIEVPSDDAVKLSLSVLTAFDGRPSHVCRRVSVQPLFAKHRQKGGEHRGSETGEEDRLDMNHGGGWAGPLWEGWNVVSERCIVDLVNEDAEEGGGLVTRELRIDLDDERRGNGRKQSGLTPQLAGPQRNFGGAHEDQGCVQILVIFLDKFFVVLLGDLAVVLVELSFVALLNG